MTATWQPGSGGASGLLDAKRVNALPNSAFAFPAARFDQVRDVTGADRELAFANIKKAAQHFGIEMKETDWRQLGSRPRGRNPA